MLKRVVEDHDINSLGDRLSDTAHPIRGRNDKDSLVQPLVHENLVTTVSTQDDRGNETHSSESAGEPRGDGRLPGPAH
jgi:hypothetical protein